MKSFIKPPVILFLIMLFGTNSFGQTELVEEFTIDLKNEKLSNLDMIDQYFIFDEKVTSSKKEEAIIPILTSQLNLLRQKLNKDCSKLIILKHDENSNVINSFKLKYKDFNNVYYILCNHTIVTPILIDGSKILSISIQSKTKDGIKSFIIF